jgi:hypothetical protein
MVRGILKRLPIEYLYGLRRVELRAREEEVGCPYAWYIPDERAIILFSLPMEWELGFGVDLIDMRDIFHAEVSELDGRWFIRWPDPELRAMWFYAAVFGHELGHHHRNQYRFRNKAASRVEEEDLADIHGWRLWRRLVQDFHARRRRQ